MTSRTISATAPRRSCDDKNGNSATRSDMAQSTVALLALAHTDHRNHDAQTSDSDADKHPLPVIEPVNDRF